jgi:hypothetical protein
MSRGPPQRGGLAKSVAVSTPSRRSELEPATSEEEAALRAEEEEVARLEAEVAMLEEEEAQAKSRAAEVSATPTGPDAPVVNESATPATMTKCAKALRAEVMALAALIGGGAADADRLAQAMLAARNAHAKVVGDAQFLARNNTSIAPALDHLDNALESFGSSVDRFAETLSDEDGAAIDGDVTTLQSAIDELIAATEPSARPTTPTGGAAGRASRRRAAVCTRHCHLRPHVLRRQHRRPRRRRPTRDRHQSLQ